MQTAVKHRKRIRRTVLALGSFIALLLGLTCPSFQLGASAQDPMDDDMDMGRFFLPIGMVAALVDDSSVANPSADPSYTRLDYPNALLTVAYDINNSGHIVGFYEDANLTFHGTNVEVANSDHNGSQQLDEPKEGETHCRALITKGQASALFNSKFTLNLPLERREK